VKIGELEAEVFLTPGHTPGSVCYYFKEQKVLFSGDVLFMGSIGRTDLPGGDMGAMRKSLELLKTFPDDTRVFSGHGPDTNIGQEKQSNPFL
jgi:glyoxylase-like metal-dependent hydrolase (beta-lactamase superfamily II)